MSVFIVDYHYVEPESARDPIRPEHRRYLYRLTEEGSLVLAGPSPDRNAGILILRADDRHHLDRLIAADPYHRNQLIEDVEVRLWSPRVGSLATQLSPTEGHGA